MAHVPKRVTLRDVARRAAVSAATASYVLSQSNSKAARIGPETRQRVLDAAHELAYVPHESGRHLRRSATQRICLSVPRLSVPFYDALAHELQREARRHGYDLILAVSREGEDMLNVLKQVQGGLADALLAVIEQTHGDHIVEGFAALAALGIPIVVMGNGMEPNGFDVVSDADDKACQDAVRYLVERGHRRIGCLALRFTDGVRHDRFDSYRRALDDLGIPIRSPWIRDAAESRSRAYTATLELLRNPSPPTALFACTDIAALSAIRAAHDLGVRIPDDLAVIGAGDIAEGRYSEPPLTTVGPVSPCFADTADLLFSRLDGRALPSGRHLVNQWKLQKRRSA